MRHLVRERRPGWVVLQCEAVTDIDVTAAGMLERLDNELNAEGVHLAFAEMRSRLRDLVHDYGLHRTLDSDHFYDSVDHAIAAIERRLRDGSKRCPNHERVGRHAGPCATAVAHSRRRDSRQPSERAAGE